MAKPDKRGSQEGKAAPTQEPDASDNSAGLFWSFSPAVRHAKGLCKHVAKILNHQRDILAPKAVAEVETALQKTQEMIRARSGKASLLGQIESLEQTASNWLKPYPNASLRENFEVLLVALAVAMAVRTFFLQPFKIPTGSMQPTLFGVTSENLSADFTIPTGLERLKQWFQGTSYLHLTAPTDGEFEGAEEPVRFLIFSLYQKYHFAGQTRMIWFPPDYGSELLAPLYRGSSLYPQQIRANIHRGQFFRKGETMIKLKVDSGDHLFVDRVSYNFRAPERGDIVVFETAGIKALNDAMPYQGDTFYIKRLAGLSGERLQLAKDFDLVNISSPNVPDTIPVGHLVVNGEHLSSSTRHFSNLYSFDGADPASKEIHYQKNRYYGHAMLGNLSPGREFTVGTNQLFVLGDNTMNSLDSRMWGDFSKSKVIGRSFFVYWPITSRFGWGPNL